MPKRIVLLLHGQSWSALPDFDLHVTRKQRSVMKAFARRGYAAYALDLRGYGATLRDDTGWLTPSRAANDVAITLQWLIRRYPHLPPPALLGWSNGSLIAQLAVQRNPTLVSALILYGYIIDPDEKYSQVHHIQEPPREANTLENAKSDFITPSAITPDVINAFAEAALRADPTQMDWQALEEWNELDAGKIKVPTLLIHGEFDPYTPAKSQAKLFTRIGIGDRDWIILRNSDHAAHLENSMTAFIAAVCNFIERPRNP